MSGGVRRWLGALAAAGLVVTQWSCGSQETTFAEGIRIDQIGARDVDVTVTDTSATIAWVTREASDSKLEWGTTDKLGSTANGRATGSQHQAVLNGLAADRIYFYRVAGSKTVFRFRTLGGTRQRLAFVSDRADGRPEVFLSYEWGENVTRVTTNGGHSPALSRDGTMLAWVANDPGGRADIWAATLDAAGVVDGSVVNLTNTTDRDEVNPDWSPDHAQLVFSAAGAGRSRIVLRNVADGAETVVVDNGAVNDEPAFRPNGSQIAFSSTSRSALVQVKNRPVDNGSVSVKLRNSGATVPATSYEVFDPAQGLIDFSGSSGAGQTVLVTYQAGGTQYTDERINVPAAQLDIFLVQPDGSGFRRVAGHDGLDSSPAWHPSQPLLVYVSENGAETNLQRVSADGSGESAVTGGGYRDLGPAVAPDGSAVVFSTNRNRDGLVNLHRVDFAGNALELGLFSSGETEPSWSVVP